MLYYSDSTNPSLFSELQSGSFTGGYWGQHYREEVPHSPFLISHAGDALKWTGRCCCCWQPWPNHDIEMLPFTAVWTIGAFFHTATRQAKEEERIKMELHKHLSEAELLRRQKCSHWFESAETKQPTHLAFYKLASHLERQTKHSDNNVHPWPQRLWSYRTVTLLTSSPSSTNMHD